MKKQLHIQEKRNKGFFLPYAIFISMLVILNLTTMITIYENATHTNHTMNELVETETLIQMTRAQFVNEEVYASAEFGDYNYEYPNGDVHLTFEWLNETTVQAVTKIETKEGTNIQRGFKLYLSEEDIVEEE